MRVFREFKDYYDKIQHPEKMFEKEYIFDEGLGQSLKEHVESIKTNFPSIEVQVRRDRDGYPVVKTLYKPQYKYNLDEISNFNPDESMTKAKESIDDLLKTLLGSTPIHELDKTQLEQKLKLISGKQKYELD